jgi:hypothetical protein
MRVSVNSDSQTGHEEGDTLPGTADTTVMEFPLSFCESVPTGPPSVVNFRNALHDHDDRSFMHDDKDALPTDQAFLAREPIGSTTAVSLKSPVFGYDRFHWQC